MGRRNSTLLYHTIIILSIFSLLLPQAGFFAEPAQNPEIEKLKQEIATKEAKIKELQEKAAAYKKTIDEKKGEANTYVNQILVLNNQIGKLNAEIEMTQERIEETDLTIEKLTLEINTKEAEIETLKKRIGTILKLVGEYDRIDLSEILLRGNNFSEIFNVAQSVITLQDEIKNQLGDLRTLKEKLNGEKEEYNAKKQELEGLESDLSYKKVITDGERKKKKNLLNITKGEEKKFQKLLSDTETKQREIQKEIIQIESKLSYLIDQSKIPSAKKGLLAWPCEGIISQGYGSTSKTGFVNPVYDFHNGIDIAASIGTAIKAPLGGKVVASGTNGNYAYGNWLAIDHQNGLITLYAHLSAKKVKVDEEIKKGQIIGYMGSTGFSTGSHLHFTVYAANTFETQEKWFGLLPVGGSLNPMNYL